jgi:hypothetical protein
MHGEPCLSGRTELPLHQECAERQPARPELVPSGRLRRAGGDALATKHK